MRVIARKTLREFWEAFPDAGESLKAWFKEAENAVWSKPHDIKEQYSTASIVTDQHVVFNICGNKYRLVVKIHYQHRIVLIRFIGTHAEYDKINVEEL